MHSDHLRRLVRDSERAQRDAMPRYDRAVSRFLESPHTAEQSSQVLLAGMSRRSLFRVGGIGLAGAVLLAACGSDGNSAMTTAPGTVPAGATDTTMAGTMPDTMPGTDPMADGDVVLLRTASSLEHLAVAAYQIAIDSGLVTTTAVGDAAMRFQEHHQEHAAFFEAATTKMGGTAFTDPNPVVLAALKPSIDALKDEAGVIALALQLERAAAATYQSGVGVVLDASLNKALMSVGGVEARHAAVLAGALGQMAVPAAFGSIDGAVAAGTGV